MIDEYVVNKVRMSCAAQGLEVRPDDSVLDVIAAMTARRPDFHVEHREAA